MQCVESGRVYHSWSMFIVGHGYGGLRGDRDGSGGLYACRSKLRGLATCREMPDHFPSARRYTDDS